MSNDDDLLSVHDLRAERVVPVGENAVDRDFKRFGAGKNCGGQTGVATLKLGVSRVLHVQFWGWNVVGAAPLQNLFFSMFLGSFCLVESLESAVVSLVESPRLVVGNPKTVHFRGNLVVRLDGSREDRCVRNIKLEPVFF